jgi:hypothetical protein
LDAGPVIFRMVSYLGAFPFQTTHAPSVLTFEAMVKVVVLLTERYGRVLKRGRKDRIKLLFGSLADVGRRDIDDKRDEGSSVEQCDSALPVIDRPSSHVAGFSIDEPANDDYEDDDDDLALAALESLDAIEVFRHDHRIDRAVYEARISVDTFRRLLMLLLVIAPLRPLESVTKHTSNLSPEQSAAIRREANTIISGFGSEELQSGIRYRNFAKTIMIALPHLFDPLTPLFEHLLFSKNLDLSRKRTGSEPSLPPPIQSQDEDEALLSPSELVLLPGSFESAILSPCMISHLSFFLPLSSDRNLYWSGTRLHPVFSTTAHGESLTSFSHNVFTWQAASLLLVRGAPTGKSDSEEDLITLGAYIPQPWKPSSSSHASINHNDRSKLPCLFQIHPSHAVLQGNSSSSVYKPTTPSVFFSTTTGIAIGCEIPSLLQQRTSFGPGVPSLKQQQPQNPPLPTGAGSLLIDAGLESAQLHTSYTTASASSGIFLPPPNLTTLPMTTHIDIYDLEIWGIVEPPPEESDLSSTKDAISLQRAAWKWDALEAERRKGVNLKVGGSHESDLQSARALLEMAGIVGHGGRGQSGGSV